MDKKAVDGAFAYAGISKKAVAEFFGRSVPTFYRLIDTENVKPGTMREIAAALGATYEERITFPDGQTFVSKQ